MRNIWTIAKREYDNYFNSNMAYVIMFGITLFLGVVFIFELNSAAQSFSAPDTSGLTWWLVFMFILAIPVLTMRLLSDEARMGTLELLLTSPVRDFELVAGKWLGAFLFTLTIIAISLFYPIVMNNYITPHLDYKFLLSAYLGVVLVSGALLAVGTGFSAITTNQFVALFVTLGLFIFSWIFLPALTNLTQNETVGNVINYLSFGSHFFDTMNQGTIKLDDIVYFLSLTALGIFIGTTAIEIRRWR